MVFSATKIGGIDEHPKAVKSTKSTANRNDNAKPLTNLVGTDEIRLPTPMELTIIASNLAGCSPLKSDGFDPEVLTDAALQLWRAAQEQILRADFQGETSRFQARWQQYKRAASQFFSSGIHLPITRDEFLKRVLPQYKNRTADLARVGKLYLKFLIKTKRISEQDVNKAYMNWSPLPTREAALRAASLFKLWYESYIKEIKTEAGKKGAAKKIVDAPLY